MNREIPGFYYDSVKRKYFRIEETKTAPAGAAWSKENVKRRAVERREGDERERKEKRAREGVKKSKALSGELVVGGLLRREVKADPTRREDLPVKVWAAGLREKGKKTLWPLTVEDEGTVSTMWVGDQVNGKGIVCAALSTSSVAVCSEILRDDDDRIDDGTWSTPPRNYNIDGHVSAIKFHQPSQTAVMLGSSHDGESWILMRQPRFLLETEGASWLAGPDVNNSVRFGGTIPNVEVHACEISPSSTRTSVSAVFGTSRGLYHYQQGESIQPIARRNNNNNNNHKKQRFKDQPPFQGDILSVDYLRQSCLPAAEIILAGTRSGHICLIDRRTPAKELESMIFRHKSSVAHLRSLPNSPHEVLAAGPRSAMAIYDVRFLKSQRNQEGLQPTNHHRPWDQKTVPVVNFPEYRNESHIKTGLDVLTEPGYGCGVVAAAHDNCTVGVYSLRDGSKICAGDVDKIKAPDVVRSLMWQTLPGDSHPSLFVGQGSVIKKYSF